MVDMNNVVTQVRVIMGHNALGIESEVSWATPGTFTVTNFPCNEDGSNCRMEKGHMKYVDPSKNVQSLNDRLAQHSEETATYLRTA